MTLEEKTPAEVAGIGIEGQNKWMELLTRTIAAQDNTDKQITKY